MKQEITAVEWFFRWFNDNPEATHKEYSEAFERAKAIEKEQIIDACFEGMNTFPFDANKGRAEQYYEQTYKTK